MTQWTRERYVARFWERVDRSAGEAGCWPWIGPLNAGYGNLSFCGRTERSNRVALIASGLNPSAERNVACHTCDNRACCNPAHLYWGTLGTNNADREARRRGGQSKRRAHANRRFVDIAGRRFGRLVAVEVVGSQLRNGRSIGATWRCVCDCGTECIKLGRYLLCGNTSSCGCLAREHALAARLSRATPVGRPLEVTP